MIEKIDICLFISVLMLVPLTYITFLSESLPSQQFDIKMLRNVSNFSPGKDKVLDDLFNILESENNDNHKVIFLLGGSGVGKANLTSVLKDSIEEVCRQNEEYKFAFYKRDLNFIEETKNPMATLCDNQYSKINKIIILAVDYIIDFKNVINNNKSVEYFGKFYKFEDQCLKNLKLKFIHIITGPIMTENDIENFKNAEEYEKFIDETAQKLNAKMYELAPQLSFNIIQFKPMTRADADISSLRINFDSELWQMYDNYTFNKDFIPHGSKFITHLIKRRLRLEESDD